MKTALCFWVFSLGLAGLCLFLIQWAGAPSLAVVGHTIYLDLSLPLLFACTAGAYGVLWALQKLFHREDFVPRACRLAITYQGKTVTLWAKADTGCALREPFSGLPVIVCQASALTPLLSPGAGEGLPGEGFRLVPFESVGGAGMLPAFRPDSVRLEPEGTVLACYVALWQRGPAALASPPGTSKPCTGRTSSRSSPPPAEKSHAKGGFCHVPIHWPVLARLFHKLFPPKPKAATTSTARRPCPRP